MLDLGGPLPSPQASLLGLSEGPLTLQSDSKSRSHLCFLSPFEPHPQHHVSPPCLPAFICGLPRVNPAGAPHFVLERAQNLRGCG